MPRTSKTEPSGGGETPTENVYTCGMDAAPLLAEVGRRLREARLEAVLIGHAAAALQGAPVTTVDFDFLFRTTSRNLAKLKAVARDLAVLGILEATLEEAAKSSRKAGRRRPRE